MFSPLFYKALTDSCKIHDSQTRKGSSFNSPYFCHLLQVAGLVLEYGGTEDAAIAALFHDSVEDRNIDLNYLKIEYGAVVADIVKGCTHDKIDKTAPKEQWADLIKEKRLLFFEKLRNEENYSVLLVTALDKLHNCRALLMETRLTGEDAFKNFKGGMEGTLWYFENLASIFMGHDEFIIKDIGDELYLTLSTIKSLPF